MPNFLNFAAGPIEQFNVYKLMDLSAGGLDLSFTNASAYMVLGSLLVIVLFWMGASKAQIVPSRLQSIAEIGYGFVADMVRGVAGEEGLKFFPFVLHDDQPHCRNGSACASRDRDRHCLWAVEERSWLFQAVRAIGCAASNLPDPCAN